MHFDLSRECPIDARFFHFDLPAQEIFSRFDGGEDTQYLV